MKSLLRIVAATLSAAGLLAVPAAQATDVADLPLKASVLAKPNVIFGYDDSGSMDSEVVLPTNDGAFWWDFTNENGWNAAGTVNFNDAGSASTQWRKMVYLFPNGTGSGNRVYSDQVNDHFAIMPSAQFAFLRSPSYNPIYYDPAVTYAPWAPAYVGGALTTYAAANPSAAKSNPAYGSATFDVTTTKVLTTSGNWVFTALPGMTIPAGAKKNECDLLNAICGGWSGALASDTPADSLKVTRVAMAYFPATYYLQESCTVDGSSCVSAPDGATLKRYEIKAANYATTSAYDAAMQNFANWWQYYRKRKLTVAGAMGEVLEGLTGLRMGFVRFNALPGSSTRVTMYDTDSTDNSANGRKLAGLAYETNGSGGTPTRQTLARIGEEFVSTAGPIEYACQRNTAFIVTDGFANVAGVTVPSYDAATWGSGAPYATTYGDSLADLALAYYTINLRPDLTPAGKVPTTATDTNADLHLNTYGLTLGARGVLYTGDESVPPTTTGAWINPNVNRHPSAVDDLWHATINGRGKMYVSDSPESTAAKLQAGLRDILAQTGAQGGVAVSTVNLSRGDGRAYYGTYNPAGWTGDVQAHPIDSASGIADDATTLWSASDLLGARDWTTRVIATSNGSAGMAFTAANVGATVNPSAVYGSDADVIDYLRGKRTLEGSQFRTRSSLLGAVINSQPAVSHGDHVLYVQSGEGMLHAIDTSASSGSGQELWAFVPQAVLGAIGQTVDRSYVFRTKLDGPITLGKAGATSLLVSGTGVAGRSFYALDVTSPRALTEAQLASRVRWQFPAVSDATTASKVGLALGRARIVKSIADGDVVLLTSGYNSSYDGKGRLWMVNASSGAIIHEFVTSAGSLASESGLAQVSGYLEDDGKVRYVYGGDLLGNVWRFDLQAKDAPKLLAVLKNDANVAQPVTAAPELVRIDGQRVVITGTGRLLDIGDFGGSSVQSVYAIADGTTLADARDGLVEQTLGSSSGVTTVTDNAVDWTSGRGWYVDLPAGEQVTSTPSSARGAVSFVTNVTGGSDCAASSKLYLLNIKTGGNYGDGFVAEVISDSANSSAATALATSGVPATVDSSCDPSDCSCASGQGVVASGQDADGNSWCRRVSHGTGIDPAKNSWREIRRR